MAAARVQSIDVYKTLSTRKRFKFVPNRISADNSPCLSPISGSLVNSMEHSMEPLFLMQCSQVRVRHVSLKLLKKRLVQPPVVVPNRRNSKLHQSSGEEKMPKPAEPNVLQIPNKSQNRRRSTFQSMLKSSILHSSINSKSNAKLPRQSVFAHRRFSSLITPI